MEVLCVVKILIILNTQKPFILKGFFSLNERSKEMTEMMTNDIKRCNRLPSRSQCERKLNNGRCPTGGNGCNSRQNFNHFNPVLFLRNAVPVETVSGMTQTAS